MRINRRCLSWACAKIKLKFYLGASDKIDKAFSTDTQFHRRVWGSPEVLVKTGDISLLSNLYRSHLGLSAIISFAMMLLF